MRNKYINTDSIIITLAHMGYTMKDGDELYDTLMKYSDSMLNHIKNNIVIRVERLTEKIKGDK
jgi:hypothetical protein